MLQAGPYALTTYPWGKAQRQMLKRAMSPRLWYGMWAVSVIFGGWIVLCFVVPGFANVFGKSTPAIAGAIGAVAFLMMARVRNKALMQAFNASVLRAGGWNVAILDDGLQMQGDLVRQVFDWAAFSDVREGPDGLLVMMGVAAYLPIPAAAFADQAAMEVFRAALSAHISAAKGER